MKIDISLISDALKMDLSQLSQHVFSSISIDSRSLQNTNETLFFALKGDNHNAHNYIEILIEKGVLFFVVEYIPENLKNKAHFIVVENSLTALQQTAIKYRSLFHFPCIGITGSNGKTIVKEWLTFLLSPNYTIVRSPKSYNSQVGVPLSIFGINEKHNLGVFEAGISTTNEMQALEKMIAPQIGVFTSLREAHSEGFSSEIEKRNEKFELFKNCEIVILEKNQSAFLDPNLNKITWSFTDSTADILVKIKEKKDAFSVLTVQTADSNHEITVPFTDQANLENAISCFAVMLYLKVDAKNIIKRLALLYPVEIRLQSIKGINNCAIIDDAYASDYQSLKLALDFLEQQKGSEKKTVILSDIFQSGLPQKTLYDNVKKMLLDHKIDRIITIGKTIGSYFKSVSNAITYDSTNAFLNQFNTNVFQNETLLVKGARSFNFQEIIAVLEEKNHETVLEVNLSALQNNLNFYKRKLKPTTKVMVMVKAFGYGNGGVEIARFLEHQGVAYLGVAFADEGITLRKAGIKTPIMVLNPENSSFSAMIAFGLEPEIYSLTALDSFTKMAQQKNCTAYPIHLKIETGMNRLGFEQFEIEALKKQLKNNNFIEVKSIFSHLASSDNTEHKAFTIQQIDLFTATANAIKNELDYSPMRHILNTSGIFNYPENQFDMVRLGIGLYGIGNTPEEQTNLHNVSTLKTIISRIKTIQKGESVGYNRRFVAPEQMKIATLPIGYADGIPRAWGNEVGYLLINNQKATIVGSICMDMLMVDVTSINCNPGQSALLFGKELSVHTMANTLNTIPYEILTGISQRVKRVFFKE